jgi:16S rRNA (uracil1498-N3)-methyltransferase
VRPHLPRFVIAQPAGLGEAVALGPEEAKHARVRRLNVGAPVALFDGRGASYVGRLESLTRAHAVVRIVDALPAGDGESPLDLVLAVATLKADRFEWLIEKATELGVRRIQPFTSTYTVARPSGDRRARWRQIALAAAKQCGRSAVPEIGGPEPFTTVMAIPAALRLLFAEDGSGEPLTTAAAVAPSGVLAIVGGEGGFTAEELAAARRSGCRCIDLGPRILRAETAALTAIALCQARWGDVGNYGHDVTGDR